MPTFEGPSLPILLRRLAETPSEFLAATHIAALVNDVLGDWNTTFSPQQLTVFSRTAQSSENDFNRLQMVAIACWLLRDDWFCENPQNAQAQNALQWLSEGLNDLSLMLPAAQIISDADRREEFARRALTGLNLHPQGESEVLARDRLQTLDSVERQQVILKTRQAQERARQIREEMARKAAEEAASRYGRE